MRHLLLAAITAISTSCATAASHDAPALSTATLTQPTFGDVHEPELPAIESGTDETLLRFDLPTASGQPLSSSTSVALTNTPDTDNDRGHHNDPVFRGPLPRPMPPNPDGELMPILIWIGTVLLNAEPDHSLEVADLSPYLSPTLATALELEKHRPTATGSSDSHRAVLLDAQINDETSTSTLVDAVLIYERTSGIGSIPLPGFELVTLTITTQHTDLGWQIVALHVSAR